MRSISIILSLKDDFTKPVNKIAAKLGKTEKETAVLNRNIKKLENNLKNGLVNGFKTAAKSATAFTAAAVGGVTALLESTKELRSDLQRLNTNAITAGVSLDVTNAAMQELAKFSDETDSNVETLSNLLAAGFDNSTIMEAVDALSGGAIKFSDTLKIEGLADSLEETMATGAGVGQFSEMIERLGYNLDDFNEGLAAAKKNGTELNYVLDFLEKTGLSNVKKTFEETNPDLVAANKQSYVMKKRMAELAAALQPAVNRLLGLSSSGIRAGSVFDLLNKGIGSAANQLNEWNQDGTLDKWGKRADSVLSGVGSAISFVTGHLKEIIPVIGGVGAAVAALKIGTTIASIFSLTTPIGLVAVGIGAVVAAIGLLITHWGDLKKAGADALNFLQNKLDALAKGAAEVGTKIGNAINKVNPFKKDDKSNKPTTTKKNALGTSYFSGGQTQINERGGEIVDLPNGTRIIPHDLSEKQVNNSKQVTVNVTIQGNVIGNQEYVNELGALFSRKVIAALGNS